MGHNDLISALRDVLEPIAAVAVRRGRSLDEPRLRLALEANRHSRQGLAVVGRGGKGRIAVVGSDLTGNCVGFVGNVVIGAG